eukprot:SAG31_NODE_1202_length_9417_cov_17.778064_3_plen_84_part_00
MLGFSEADLVYFKDEKLAASGAIPQGSIPLEEAEVEPYEKADKAVKPKFKIRTHAALIAHRLTLGLPCVPVRVPQARHISCWL